MSTLSGKRQSLSKKDILLLLDPSHHGHSTYAAEIHSRQIEVENIDDDVDEIPITTSNPRNSLSTKSGGGEDEIEENVVDGYEALLSKAMQEEDDVMNQLKVELCPQVKHEDFKELIT